MTTKNFLGCFKLETGGYVIGFFHAISSIFVIFLMLYLIYTLGLPVCPNKECANIRDSTYLLISFCLTVAMFSALISIKCIKGVKQRNSSYIRPLLVLLVISTIAGLLFFLFSPSIQNLVYCFVFFVNGYSSYVLWSLSDIFDQELLPPTEVLTN